MFLDEPRWQTVPWELEPTSKTPQSYLLDIFVSIPTLLEEDAVLERWSLESADYDFIDPSPILDDGYFRGAELHTRVASQLETLYRWRWKWQREYGRCVTLDHCDGNAEPSNRLQFDRALRANDIMLYNSILMWLLALLWKLDPSRAESTIRHCTRAAAASVALTPSDNLHGHPSSPGLGRDDPSISFKPLQHPEASISIRDAAVEICHVYEWKSRNHGKVSSSEDQMCLYLFPVGMAKSVLDREPEYKAWIGSMLDASPHTRAYGRDSDNIAGFAYYITQEALSPSIAGTEYAPGDIWAKNN
jgi:hypothetical protein